MKSISTLILLISLVGCSRSAPAPVPTGETPPPEMRRYLQALHGDNVKLQLKAMDEIQRFPAIVKAQRDRLELLNTSGSTPQVKQKAGELLKLIPADEGR